jgi:hypothetical protein
MEEKKKKVGRKKGEQVSYVENQQAARKRMLTHTRIESHDPRILGSLSTSDQLAFTAHPPAHTAPLWPQVLRNTSALAPHATQGRISPKGPFRVILSTIEPCYKISLLRGALSKQSTMCRAVLTRLHTCLLAWLGGLRDLVSLLILMVRTF